MQLVTVSGSYEWCVMVNEIEQSVIRVFYAASNALWPGTYDERIIFILDTLTQPDSPFQPESSYARLYLWTAMHLCMCSSTSSIL